MAILINSKSNYIIVFCQIFILCVNTELERSWGNKYIGVCDWNGVRTTSKKLKKWKTV